MYGLAKIAASFDAQRNKQYWQMLKRLHGGSDEAVSAIKTNGDDGIWHGTRAEFLPEIEAEGLKAGGFREFGVGTFFGDKKTAHMYGRDEARTSRGTKLGNMMHNGKDIRDQDEMASVVRANPDPRSDYVLSEGASVRLAKPSELAGTKTLYPNPNAVKVFDMKDKDSLKRVAPSQTAHMAEHDDAIQRARSMFKSRLLTSQGDEQRKMMEELVRMDVASQPDFVRAARTKEDFAEDVDYLVNAVSSEPSTKETARLLKSYTSPLGEELASKLMVPRNQQELNQLQYYGKLRGRRVFDRLNPENARKEMFFDRQGISPELLRHADGRSMSTKNFVPEEVIESPAVAKPISSEKEMPLSVPTATTKPTPSEAEVSQTMQVKDKSMWPYIGLGAAGVGATGGLAYLAHKKNKEKKQEGEN